MCISSTIVYALCIGLLDSVTVVVLNQVACNWGSVVAWCIIPSVLIEDFGETHFVILWGIIQVWKTTAFVLVNDIINLNSIHNDMFLRLPYTFSVSVAKWRHMASWTFVNIGSGNGLLVVPEPVSRWIIINSTFKSIHHNDNELNGYDYNIISCCFQLFYGIFSFALQMTLGAFYDLQLEISGDLDLGLSTCSGQMCFTYSFVICTFICAVSSVLSGLYLWKRRQHFGCFQGKTVVWIIQ